MRAQSGRDWCNLKSVLHICISPDLTKYASTMVRRSEIFARFFDIARTMTDVKSSGAISLIISRRLKNIPSARDDHQRQTNVQFIYPHTERIVLQNECTHVRTYARTRARCPRYAADEWPSFPRRWPQREAFVSPNASWNSSKVNRWAPRFSWKSARDAPKGTERFLARFLAAKGSPPHAACK